MTTPTLKRGLLAALAIVAVQLWLPVPQWAQQAPRVATFVNGQEEIEAGGYRLRVDPRVQQRRYTLKDTNETLPYALFVSSRVTRAKESPLIVALHGRGVNQNGLMLELNRMVEFAEQGGYVLVAPMGYNLNGWYGIPLSPGRGGRGAPEGNTIFANTGGTAVTEPARVRELSERDVLNVLSLTKAEFNVDERRTYLLGHSMGGAGAFYIGVKYANEWAAIAAIAPAPSALQPDVLTSIKTIPVLVVQGDADAIAVIDNARRWVDKLKELGMTYEYREIPGADHGGAVTEGMPDVFAFFGKHSK